MKCSFCLCDKEPSKEHIIPYALGGSLTTYSVCKDCNSSLGSTIDSKFILNKAVGIARRVRVGQFQLPYDLSAA